MNHTIRKLILALTTVFAAAGGASAADPFPSKPITILTPFAAGGIADRLGRMIAIEMTGTLKQNVLVENRPGASGMIAIRAVGNAPADGHTLLLASSSFITNTLLYTSVNYKLDEFAAVSHLIKNPLAMVASPAIQANNATDFVRLAKASPGKLNFASLGTGGVPQLMGKMLERATGISLVEVPYKGAAPALQAIMTNEVQIYFDSVSSALPQFKAGRVKFLGITSDERLAAVQDVPTLKEQGINGMTVMAWFGIVAPVATPKPIIDQLSRSVKAGVASNAFQTLVKTDGGIPISSTPEVFAAELRQDVETWSSIIRPLNIKLD